MKGLQYRFGELRALPEDVDESRTIEFVISDQTRDRHNTIIPIRSWRLDNYKKNPIVGYQHNVYGDMFGSPNPDDIIGKSEVYVDGENLVGRVTFEPPEINPLAEKIFQKVKFGTLRTASVGFAPVGDIKYGKGEEAQNGKNPTRYYSGAELMEWSIVNIPSNPNAVKRELIDQTEKVVEFFLRALSEKYTEEDIMKMTLKGIIGLLNDESINRDITEREVTDANEVKAELERLKVKRAMKIMDAELAYHNVDTKVDEITKAEKKKYELEKRRMAREFNHSFGSEENLKTNDNKNKNEDD